MVTWWSRDGHMTSNKPGSSWYDRRKWPNIKFLIFLECNPSPIWLSIFQKFQTAAGGKTYRHRVVKIYISNHICNRGNLTRMLSTYALDSVSDWISVTAGWTTEEQMDSSRFKSLFLLMALLKIRVNDSSTTRWQSWAFGSVLGGITTPFLEMIQLIRFRGFQGR